MKKRFLSILLTFAMLLALTPSVFADGTNIDYSVLEDGYFWEDIMYGKTPINTDVTWANLASQMTDANSGTQGTAYGGYAVYDLGEKTKIGGVELIYNYRDNAGVYKLEGSNTNNGTDWETIYTFDNDCHTNATKYTAEKFFEQKEYQYVKLSTATTNENSVFFVYEFKLYEAVYNEHYVLPVGYEWKGIMSGKEPMSTTDFQWSNPAAQMTDGNPNTQATAYGGYAVYDLGKKTKIGGTKLIYNYRDNAGVYKLEGSNTNNGTDWETIYAYDVDDCASSTINTDEEYFEEVEYQYIRLSTATTNKDSVFFVYEFELYTIGDDPAVLDEGYIWKNVAGTATEITTEGTVGNGDPANMVDGSESTAYVLATGYVVFDLGAKYKIGGTKIKYNYRNNTGKYTLYGSNTKNGDDWTPIYTYAVPNPIHEVDNADEVYFEEVEYQYIKLSTEGSGVFKVYEFGLYSPIKDPAVLEEGYIWKNVLNQNTTVEVTNNSPTNWVMGEPANMFDGIGKGTNSYFALNPGYVVFDLGEKKKIRGTELVYNYRNNTGKYTLYGSNTKNGDDWTPIYTYAVPNPNDNTDNEDTVYFEEVEYQYIKLSTEGIGVFKVYEFGLYSPIKDPDVLEEGCALIDLVSGKLPMETTDFNWNIPAAQMTDGNPDTQATAYGGYAVYDLGKKTKIDGVELVYNYRDTAGVYTLSGSDDAVEWTPIYTFDNDSHTNATKYTAEKFFEQKEYRYVKLSTAITSASSVFYVYEFKLYTKEQMTNLTENATVSTPFASLERFYDGWLAKVNSIIDGNYELDLDADGNLNTTSTKYTAWVSEFHLDKPYAQIDLGETKDIKNIRVLPFRGVLVAEDNSYYRKNIEVYVSNDENFTNGGVKVGEIGATALAQDEWLDINLNDETGTYYRYVRIRSSLADSVIGIAEVKVWGYDVAATDAVKNMSISEVTYGLTNVSNAITWQTNDDTKKITYINNGAPITVELADNVDMSTVSNDTIKLVLADKDTGEETKISYTPIINDNTVGIDLSQLEDFVGTGKAGGNVAVQNREYRLYVTDGVKSTDESIIIPRRISTFTTGMIAKVPYVAGKVIKNVAAGKTATIKDAAVSTESFTDNNVLGKEEVSSTNPMIIDLGNSYNIVGSEMTVAEDSWHLQGAAIYVSDNADFSLENDTINGTIPFVYPYNNGTTAITAETGRYVYIVPTRVHPTNGTIVSVYPGEVMLFAYIGEDEVDAYLTSDVTYTDETNTTTVKTIKANADNLGSNEVILAEYNNDKLIRVLTGSNAEMPYVAGNAYKAFVWNSLAGMKPVGESVEYEPQ